jgi:hypothetical protein
LRVKGRKDFSNWHFSFAIFQVPVQFHLVETRCDKQTKSEPGSGSDRPEIQAEKTAEYSKPGSVELNIWPVATATRF